MEREGNGWGVGPGREEGGARDRKVGRMWQETGKEEAEGEETASACWTTKWFSGFLTGG